jgi:hypothetical protein
MPLLQIFVYALAEVSLFGRASSGLIVYSFECVSAVTEIQVKALSPKEAGIYQVPAVFPATNPDYRNYGLLRECGDTSQRTALHNNVYGGFESEEAYQRTVFYYAHAIVAANAFEGSRDHAGITVDGSDATGVSAAQAFSETAPNARDLQ